MKLHSFQTRAEKYLKQLQDLVDKMPDKGLKSEDSQKVCFQIAIDKLQAIINGTEQKDLDEHEYVVNVGNIGNIEAKDKKDAIRMYREYVRQSKSGNGRAAGEPVCILEDGESMDKYDYCSPNKDDE